MGRLVRLQDLIERPAVSAVGRAASRRRFLVLAYHGVSDAGRFREQMLAVTSHRRPVSLSEVEERLCAGRELPAGGFLVTFDDGRRSVLESGLPVLRDLGIPAALFVVAGLVGTDEPFWWDEVVVRSDAGGSTTVAPGRGSDLLRSLKQVPDADRRRALDELRVATASTEVTYPHLRGDELVELDRSGVAIGSHSLSHPCLDRCDDDVLDAELKESRQRLEGILGREVVSLAYPNGNVDRRVTGAAGRAGYSVGFAFDHRMTRRRVADPMSVSRVRVDPADEPARFDSVVAGVHPSLHHLRGRS